LPEGFKLLFAPAAALPAPVERPPLTLLPVVWPLGEVPVVVPLEGGAPVAAGPPAAPLLLCASADPPTNASAAANPIVISRMLLSFAVLQRRTSARGMVSSGC
jgi:hypothetical protein